MKNKQASKAVSKQKRWKKGQSSSSNPANTKHRDAAKHRFFHSGNEGSGIGASRLTTEALKKHDANNSDELMEPESDAATFKTWATHLTECTNTTFNRVHENWKNDAVHKEVLAVLAAVTEIIKTQGGQETELEYFAILMTTLESTGEDTAALTATVYLLSLVIKKLPHTVLQAKFKDITSVFMTLIEQNASKDGSSIISKLISCVTTVLRVQNKSTWNQQSTIQTYTNLLALSLHSKPKVRKAVRDAVSVVLRASEIIKTGESAIHPAAAATEKYCSSQIQQLLNNTLIQKSKDLASCSDIIHTLQVIRHVIGCFPRNSIKSTCELVLKLMSLNNLVLKGVCLEVLNTLFNSKPSAEQLPSDINAKLITALYDYQPNINDIAMVPAWLLVMETSLINLVRHDQQLCLSHLPRFVSVCIKCFTSSRMESMTAAAVSLKSILLNCVKEIDGELLADQSEKADSPICKVISSLESTLGYQYHSSWSFSLQVLSTAFEILGSTCTSLLSQMLPLLADLRDSSEFGFKAELDAAVGSAIRYLGPRSVLTAIPLEISASGNDIKRSWLMPLLRTHISHTELAFFIEYFLPLAEKSSSISAQQRIAGNVIQQKVHEALVNQIWSLLPAFCSKPTDLTQSLKNIARGLGQALSDRPDLRKNVLSALRKLINSAQENDEYKTEMAKYAKNYLPILFNIYTNDEDESGAAEHQVVLDTIRDYLTVTEQGLVKTFFDTCMKKIVDDKDMTKAKRNSLLDIAINMVVYVDAKRMGTVCQYVGPLLQSEDKSLQKKSYRFLENICSMKTADCSAFVSENLSELQSMLLTNLSTSSPSSKGPRLRCLAFICKALKSENKDFLVAVLPEAILCTKEVGDAARKAAYDLLITMCEANIAWNQDLKDDSESVMEFVALIVAGFAGSTHMIHASINALTSILFEYKQSMTSVNLCVILQHCCTLIRSKTKEIVLAALSLLKVIIASFEVTELSKHIQEICDAIKTMRDENKHHLRFKVKEVLERLVRKFGYETISKLLPNTYQKQLANIKKSNDRKKRDSSRQISKDTTDTDGEDVMGFKSMRQSQPESVDEILESSDSELEDDSKLSAHERSNKKRTMPAWLREGGDEITDFLDKQASSNILATRPTVRQPANSSNGKADAVFKTAADGRMVITELEEDREISANYTADDGQAELEDIDDIFDQFEMQAGKQAKKRKYDVISESASQISASTYKTGGKGIHRALDKKRSKTDTQSQTGAEFQSKKGAGDVKKKNKLDPYAYVPLNVNSLNKRKAAKMKGQFKSFIGGAKKGAAKGKKARHVKKMKQ